MVLNLTNSHVVHDIKHALLILSTTDHYRHFTNSTILLQGQYEHVSTGIDGKSRGKVLASQCALALIQEVITARGCTAETRASGHLSRPSGAAARWRFTLFPFSATIVETHLQAKKENSFQNQWLQPECPKAYLKL